MSNVFIGYAKKDLERVRPLVKLLEEQGWTVFWDRKVPPGSTWPKFIHERTQAAQCIVVLWSEHSVESRWVNKEARVGAERGILVQVLLDDVEVPFEFDEVQAAGFVGYPDSVNEAEKRAFLDAITSCVDAEAARKAEEERERVEAEAAQKAEEEALQTRTLACIRRMRVSLRCLVTYK